ncbi:MAG: GntP family permease [Flavobacteriaceae bacterium]|nr:GntP family permease [Flavobacteriaceae bacterium]
MFKIKPHIALLSAGLISGLILKISFLNSIIILFEGFKSIIISVGPIIIVGTILGKILQETGSAKKMVGSFISFFGFNKIPLTLNIIGFIISIPVFCDAAFILMSSIIKEVSNVSGKKIIILAVCLATGLYSAHVFVPPTPGPLAAAAILEVDIGLLLIIGLFTGLIVSFFGYLWTRLLFKKDFKINYTSQEIKSYDFEKSLVVFLPIIIPIILISLSTIIKYPSLNFTSNNFLTVVSFIGKPEIALIIGVIISVIFIDKSKTQEVPKWIIDSLKKSLDILLITGAGGAFGFIIRSSELVDHLSLSNLNGIISLVSVYLISAIIKTIQGSSTVALITTCALVAPLIHSLGITSEVEKVILLISIGSGAMTMSHVNDSYFWVVSKYSNINMNETLKYFTSATLIQGILGLLVSITLYVFLA